MENLLRRACPNARDRMSIANLLNHEGEDACVEIPTDDNLIAEIVAKITGQENIEIEELDAAATKPTTKDVQGASNAQCACEN